MNDTQHSYSERRQARLQQLGHEIRQAREAHPDFKSLRAFSEVVGRSASWISKVERGKERPSSDSLALIADLLAMDRAHVFGLAAMLEPDIEAVLTVNYEKFAPKLRRLVEEEFCDGF